MLKILIALTTLLFTQTSFAEKILIVGDSHSCGYFGSTLVKELTDKGHQVKLFCMVSSSPIHWLNGSNPRKQYCKTISHSVQNFKSCQANGTTPKLEAILAQGPYDSAIIALGTNSLHLPSANSTYSQMAEMVSAKIRSCFWIAPPHLRPDQAKEKARAQISLMEKNIVSFYSSLENSVGNSCRLIGSLQITNHLAEGTATQDGIHRTPNSGSFWAMSILSALPF